VGQVREGAPRDRSCTRCGLVEAQEGAGDARRRSAPTGHRIPARGETPGMAHNRCVLKERRIRPDSLACFAAAECQGWRWGSVPRRGLRGTGSLDRFVVGLRGTSPALAGNVGTGGAFARPRDGDQDVDVPTLAPARSRYGLAVADGIGPTYLHKRGHSLLYRCRCWGSAGPILRSLPLRGGARRLWGCEAFGVPQRGTAYQPGVKPRVCRTTGAF